MLLPEEYRGIEFIRIASLPAETKENFQASFDRSKIIKILRDKELLVDCVLYTDFLRWQTEKTPHTEAAKPNSETRISIPVR